MKNVVEIINETEIDLIDTLNNTNTRAKDGYMASPDMAVPDNEYGNFDSEQIKNNIFLLETALEELRDVCSGRARIEKILLEDNLRQNRFAYINGQWRKLRENADESEKNRIRKEHQELNRQIFGLPVKETFFTILCQKLDSIDDEKLSSDDIEMHQDLLQLLGNISMYPRGGKLYTPDTDVFERFAELAEDFLCPILRHIDPDKEIFTIQEACDIANEVLENELGEKNRWHAVVEEGGATACVIPIYHEMRFPKRRSKGDYTRFDLRAILAHELGTHVLRSIPYTDCAYRTVSTGLPGYVGFEEGIARGMEQAVNHKYEPSGCTHYVSIGLAYFMNKNFREVYEIQKRLEHLAGNEPEGRCFDSVQRTFRGTGDLLNCKDLAYFNGTVKFWKFVENHIDDPDLFDYLYLYGKSDITRKEHADLIYALKTAR